MSEKNYHSRLLDISNKFDKVIQRLKSGYVDLQYQKQWLIWLLLAPLRDLAKIKTVQDGFTKFLSSSVGFSLIPIGSLAAGPLVFHGLELDMPLFIQGLISWSMGYLLTMFLYFPSLLNFESEHFHLGAYRVFRKQEYKLFQGAFLDSSDEFYFKGLYDYVTRKGDVVQLVEKRLGDFLQNERQEYKSEIRSLKDELKKSYSERDELLESIKEIQDEYDQFIFDLIQERDESIKELEYLIQLLKDINMLLYRKFNGSFSKRDLNILTGFTLYELREDKLVLIEDVQTSSASPKEIKLDDPKYKNYGAVRVILDDAEYVPYINEPYPEHMVISYRLNMDHKAQWVYNFHFDKSNERILKLLVETGKIDSREIYRLIHALSLLSIDKDNFFKREAANQ